MDSTNTEAVAWAAEGAPHGAVVLADYQTRGRGRHGRTWQADAGHNLLYSVILRPTFKPAEFGLITLAASLSVADAVTVLVAPSAVQVKWPNDVLIDGSKCCGILSESAIGTETVVVVGIGLNVNQSEFPPELSDRATSIRLAAGQCVDRTALLVDILRRFEKNLAQLNAQPSSIIQQFCDKLYGRGQLSNVRLADGRVICGRIDGLAATGALRMDTGGETITILDGELFGDVANC